MKLTSEIFLSFARFIEPFGREAIFAKGRSDLFDYDYLLQRVRIMQNDDVITDLKDYLFGPNEEAVTKRLTNLRSYFLWLDYGALSSYLDGVNNFRDSFSLAITIGYPLADFTGDMVEQVIVSDNCLEMLLAIRTKLISEEKERPWLKDLSSRHVISPWVQKDKNCLGWTMIFDRQGFDMLQGKMI